jgi:nucleotide-binding universal stress UspA family protein
MYQHVMVPLDGSELAECVLPHVEAIGTGCNVARVTLVRVVPPLKLHGGVETSLSPEARQQLEDDGKTIAAEYLEAKAGELTGKGVATETAVLFGEIVHELIGFSTAHEVDLIITATHGRSGVSRWFLGSIADRTLRASPVPVLMVRAPGSHEHHK